MHLMKTWYQDRRAIIATMHGKEAVIAPLFDSAFAISSLVPPDFDTDQFGTFTREIARQGSQLDSARAKAKAALDTTGETLAIASEGRFGPHPQIPWVASNHEIVLLLDLAYGFEVYASYESLDTNYEQAKVKSLEEAIAFAQRVHFPTHGLVLTVQTSDQTEPLRYKGLNDWDVLKSWVQTWQPRSTTGLIQLETDMRAMQNPMRMEVIRQATERLIQHLQQTCPDCHCPGFTVIEAIPGLPCEWCWTPTGLICKEIYGCQKCDRREARVNPDKPFAAPAYCPNCNP